VEESGWDMNTRESMGVFSRSVCYILCLKAGCFKPGAICRVSSPYLFLMSVA
jgi:hypothetical protein